jgi:hypothetical protein
LHKVVGEIPEATESTYPLFGMSLKSDKIGEVKYLQFP